MIYITQYCFSCGNWMENDICVHPRCKRDMRRFCEKCGAQSIDGIVFCLSCGEKFAEMPDPQPYVYTEGDYRLTNEETVTTNHANTQRESPKVKKPPLIVMHEPTEYNNQPVNFEKSEIIEKSVKIEPQKQDSILSFPTHSDSDIGVILKVNKEPESDIVNANIFQPQIHAQHTATIRFDIFAPEDKQILAIDRILAPKIQLTHVSSKPNVFALNTVDGYGVERG